jgi:hypothetical protein
VESAFACHRATTIVTLAARATARTDSRHVQGKGARSARVSLDAWRR